MIDIKQKNQTTPAHIGIIMDGNHRWARERNLPILEGHAKGYEKMKHSLEWFFSRGVKVVSFFAFSIEDWQHSREEVNYLMKLFKQAIIDDLASKALRRNYKILVNGRIDELPGDLPQSCYDIMEKTSANQAGTINICFNYGGRAEIVDATRKLIKNKVEIEQIHEGLIKKYLYQGDLPDLDIIVRTSGEQKLSGFLLWQSYNSELIFLKKYWPEFEEADVDFILREFGVRSKK
ncbi:MAG: di-trans,poly-cis-decaprenylcistransferase [Flavobacterium sp.]|nr:di-trans,poly-cis-decaprenylcistransferase [Flavobacterium sp.]